MKIKTNGNTYCEFFMLIKQLAGAPDLNSKKISIKILL